MKFFVSRTSDPEGKDVPCKYAKYEKIGKTNRSAWAVEVFSLEDLVDLIRAEDEDFILSTKIVPVDGYDGCIEIYDDYRE